MRSERYSSKNGYNGQMILRDTTQSDIDYLAKHTRSHGSFNKKPDQVDFTYTLEQEGNVLCIGGLNIITPTTGWVWVDISDKANGQMKNVYRYIRDWLCIFTEDKGLIRLQAHVEKGFPEAIRMIEHLGFEYESTMKRFYGEKDFLLYVRLK